MLQEMVLPRQDLLPIRHLKPTEVNIAGYKVGVYMAPQGSRIDMTGEAIVSRGLLDFDTVVDFGQVFLKNGMWGTTVNFENRWQESQVGSTVILANHQDSRIRQSVESHLEGIVNLVNPDNRVEPTLNPQAIEAYWDHIKPLVEHEKEELEIGGEEIVPIAAARAGVPMMELFGFKGRKLLIIDAKRLNLVNQPGAIAVGIRFPETIDEVKNKLEGKQVLCGDPAAATLGTQLAVLSFAQAAEINIPQFTWAAISAAQQGLELGNRVADEMARRGVNIRVITAGNYPTLTGGVEHPFYIQDERGRFAAGDAGDFSDLLLKGPTLSYRKLWPPNFTLGHIYYLSQNYSTYSVSWHKLIQPGEPVTLESMLRLQTAAQIADPNLPSDAIGTVLTKRQ